MLVRYPVRYVFVLFCSFPAVHLKCETGDTCSFPICSWSVQCVSSIEKRQWCTRPTRSKGYCKLGSISTHQLLVPIQIQVLLTRNNTYIMNISTPPNRSTPRIIVLVYPPRLEGCTGAFLSQHWVYCTIYTRTTSDCACAIITLVVWYIPCEYKYPPE